MSISDFWLHFVSCSIFSFLVVNCFLVTTMDPQKFSLLLSQAKDLGLSGADAQAYVSSFLDREDAKAKDERAREEKIKLKQLDIAAKEKAAELAAKKEADELALKQRELDHKERMAELELQKAASHRDSKTAQDSVSAGGAKGARYPKMPFFNETKDDIDSYLFRFESFAESAGLKKENWAMFLGVHLHGSA